MGVKKTEIVEYTCDKCGGHMDRADEGKIYIETDGGGRDIGPSTISGRLYFNQDYGVSDGIICKRCMVKYLTG